MPDALNGLSNFGRLPELDKTADRHDSTSEKSSPSPFNALESRLLDQVDINPEILSNIENLRSLERRLSLFADVLKGKRSIGGALLELKTGKDYPAIPAHPQKEGIEFARPPVHDIEATINATRERLFKTQTSIMEGLQSNKF